MTFEPHDACLNPAVRSPVDPALDADDVERFEFDELDEFAVEDPHAAAVATKAMTITRLPAEGRPLRCGREWLAGQDGWRSLSMSRTLRGIPGSWLGDSWEVPGASRDSAVVWLLDWDDRAQTHNYDGSRPRSNARRRYS